MSNLYECKASDCLVEVLNCLPGPAFFCRTAGMNEHFRPRSDGTNALVPDDCSPACRCSDDGDFFHDAECARRLVARERARSDVLHQWDEWWRSFLDHVTEHGVGYGGVY